MGGSQTHCISYTYSSFKMFEKSTRFALAIFNLKVFGARHLGSSVHVYTVYSTCYKSPAKRFLRRKFARLNFNQTEYSEGGGEQKTLVQAMNIIFLLYYNLLATHVMQHI